MHVTIIYYVSRLLEGKDIFDLFFFQVIIILINNSATL